jgi:hypothetical protein
VAADLGDGIFRMAVDGMTAGANVWRPPLTHFSRNMGSELFLAGVGLRAATSEAMGVGFGRSQMPPEVFSKLESRDTIASAAMVKQGGVR